MFRIVHLLVVIGLLSFVAAAQAQQAKAAPSPSQAPPDNWITISNGYAKLLTDVSFAHHPEAGSQQGLSQFDNKVSQPTLADEDRQRQQMEAVLLKLKAAAAEKQPTQVTEDLQIMIDRVQLDFKQQDYARAHEVPYYNASGAVFGGLHILLDEQTPNERRPAAVMRIREYAGLEPGYKPLTEILKQRAMEHFLFHLLLDGLMELVGLDFRSLGHESLHAYFIQQNARQEPGVLLGEAVISPRRRRPWPGGR